MDSGVWAGVRGLVGIRGATELEETGAPEDPSSAGKLG